MAARWDDPSRSWDDGLGQWWDLVEEVLDFTFVDNRWLGRRAWKSSDSKPIAVLAKKIAKKKEKQTQAPDLIAALESLRAYGVLDEARARMTLIRELTAQYEWAFDAAKKYVTALYRMQLDLIEKRRREEEFFLFCM